VNVLLLKDWLAHEGSALIGARLSRVSQLDGRSIVLELITEDGGNLLLLGSALEEYPALARLTRQEAEALGESADGDERSVEGSFVKALRFHLLGLRLIGILQEGFDRSVTFTFCKTDMYGRETLRQLRFELVGRASNAYLLSATHVSRCEGNVISIFKRVRREQNRVRQVLTGKALPPPPPLGKFIAAEADADALAEELAEINSNEGLKAADGKAVKPNALEQLFTRRVAGCDVKLWPLIEPLLPVTYDIQTLHGFINQLQHGNLTAELFGLGSDGRNANAVIIEQWLAARRKRGHPGSSPASMQPELAKRLDQLSVQLGLAERAEELEHLALDLLARADELERSGDSQTFLRNWAAEHEDWAAEVDLLRSVHENGQALLHYSQRLRRGVDKLQRVINTTTAQLAELEQARLLTPAKKAKPAAAPLASDESKLNKFGVKFQRYLSSDGLQILCGMSDKSNDGLLRIYGSSRHLWLHARDFPGSHVLILSNGREVPERSLREAAVIAAYHSQGRGELEVDVSYLPMKHLKRPKGGKPGQVLKTSEKVLNVSPGDYEHLRYELQRGTQAQLDVEVKRRPASSPVSKSRSWRRTG
jgi:predicted ribosome quality control (RQC) complex YloA/Tae2 family protein